MDEEKKEAPQTEETPEQAAPAPAEEPDKKADKKDRKKDKKKENAYIRERIVKLNESSDIHAL